MDEADRIFRRLKALYREIDELTERLYLLKTQQVTKKRTFIAFYDSIQKVVWDGGEITFSKRAYRRYNLIKRVYFSKHKRVSEDYVSLRILHVPLATSNVMNQLVSRTSKDLKDSNFPYSMRIINGYVVLKKS